MLPILVGALIVSRRLVVGTLWVIVRGTVVRKVCRLSVGETALLDFYIISVGFLQACKAGIELGWLVTVCRVSIIVLMGVVLT